MGFFIWDLLETLQLGTFETSVQRSCVTLWRRITETLLDVSFETYLRRCWDGQKDVAKTSKRRPHAGWACIFSENVYDT